MAYFEFRTNPMYVQGPDALLELKRYSYHLGQRFLIVTGCGPITGEVVDKVKKSFDYSMESNVQKSNLRYAAALAMAQKYDKENKDITYELYDFEGKQVTLENIDALTEVAKKMNADVIIGIGGGKALDVVRGVYHKIDCKVVLCPTAAATNAPASTLTVLYNEAGEPQGVWRMDYHPSLVLTDMNVIINAPAITISAGMGDCMGTYYEGLITIQELNRQNQIVDPAWIATHAVKENFYKNGYEAIVAAKNKAVTPAYESVISQIVHTSGPMSTTVAVHFPHIVDELLLCFEQCKPTLHGLLVGYGVIPFMVWAHYPLKELYEYVDFCVSVGIPVTFDEIGIANEPVEALEKAAEVVINGPTIQMTTAKITKEDLYKSMLIGEKLITEYLGRV